MEKRIKEIMGEILEIDVNDIDENTSPETTQNWVSLRHMNLIVALEDEFKITFREDEIIELLSYKAILDSIKSKVA